LRLRRDSACSENFSSRPLFSELVRHAGFWPREASASEYWRLKAQP
jgi:hypothetical protein